MITLSRAAERSSLECHTCKKGKNFTEDVGGVVLQRDFGQGLGGAAGTRLIAVSTTGDGERYR